MSKEIRLETKFVGEITGVFFVPDYQRGYRWETEEVLRLLDDIYNNGKKTYCLQPIVVKRKSDTYELVDGQQRLTTLYLIYKFMHTANPNFFSEPTFSLIYDTREKSAAFLQNIDLSLADDNIDFYFICNAYKVIKNWFEKDIQSRVIHMFEYLKEDVKVIWYEVDEEENAVGLFTRLNIGKIPLTSAELIKALFLSSGTGLIDEHKQKELAFQWDAIERELRNKKLWSFLSNKPYNSYQTKIDLVLDLIADKKPNIKDKYYTYFEFEKRYKEGTLSLDDQWDEVVHSFYLLKDWYENHTLYHKIGYLIASGSESLNTLFRDSKDLNKSEYISKLDDYIRKSIKTTRDYSDYTYTADKKEIYKLLLLFNVESVRLNGEQTEWFPFDKFKYSDDGKVIWSLEHIHAQQSEGMKKEEQWRKWLSYHLPFVELKDDELTDEIRDLLSARKIEGFDFDKLQSKVLELLSPREPDDYIHKISNLALLNCNDNAALSNSVFAVKRDIIIKMDQKGQFIPFCTKMAFLKYYTPSVDEAQMLIWSPEDRKEYIKAMNRILANYLSCEIDL